MNKILILGGSGFIGKSLVSKLEKTNSVKLMIHNSDIKTNSKKFKANILSKSSFIDEIDNDQTIINLLGQMTANESDFFSSNIIGGLNLLNSCIEKKIKQIILISSINVYGENLDKPSKETDALFPKTMYANVKMLTENLYKDFSKTFGINVTILRLAGIYGPSKKNGFLTKLINSTKDKKIIPECYNNGNQQRDLLFIDDAVNCIHNAIDYEHNGFEIFNVSSGKRYSMNDLISKIKLITNTELNIKYNSEIPDEKCIWADNSKAKKLLNFKPKIDIDSGLKFSINNML
jgi:nucleoside-diphosphate-sugar epimerase